MTIQQLYDFAKEHNIADYDLNIEFPDGGDFYCGIYPVDNFAYVKFDVFETDKIKEVSLKLP